MRTKTAFIVVDLQNDFCEGGALAVEGGAQTARDISVHLATHDYDVLVTTQDWHSPDDDNEGHFTKWPQHCVADTVGADFHPALALPRTPDIKVFKGMGVEGYSGFDTRGSMVTDGTDRPFKSTSLADVLRSFGVREVTIGGIAFDFCVSATADAAADAAFVVNVPMNLTVGIYRDSLATIQRLLRNKGVRVY